MFSQYILIKNMCNFKNKKAKARIQFFTYVQEGYQYKEREKHGCDVTSLLFQDPESKNQVELCEFKVSLVYIATADQQFKKLKCQKVNKQIKKTASPLYTGNFAKLAIRRVLTTTKEYPTTTKY